MLQDKLLHKKQLLSHQWTIPGYKKPFALSQINATNKVTFRIERAFQ